MDKKENVTMQIKNIIDLENTRCYKQDYKYIFKNKDKIQVDFINKYLKEDVTPDDLIKFIVALTCEFVGEERVRYFQLPNIRFENLNLGEAYYSFWENKIAVSANCYSSLTLNKHPYDFLDLVDNIGHEMTHFMQYCKLINRLATNHREYLDDNSLFMFDDNLFDEWMLQVIRPTLDKNTAKKVKGLTAEELAFTINFNNYYLSAHEKSARLGSVEFQNKMMAKWSKEPIEQTKLWLKIQKLHKKSVFEKQNNGMLKSTKKYDRAIASKFLTFVPDLEKLKYNLQKEEFREHILNESVIAIKNLSPENLVYSYWEAIKGCNEIMISTLIDTMSRNLPQEQFEEVMQKTFVYLSKNKNAYRYDKNTGAYADVLLCRTGFDAKKVAYILFTSVFNMNIECLDAYLRKMKPCRFFEEVIKELVDFLTYIYEEKMAMIERDYPLYQQYLEEGRNVDATKMRMIKEKFAFCIKVADELLPYLSKFEYHYEEFKNYRDAFEKYKHLLSNIIKKSKSNTIYMYNNHEFEA